MGDLGRPAPGTATQTYMILPAHFGKEGICPQCKKSFALRGRSNTQAATCSSCSTYFSTVPWNDVDVKFNYPYVPVLQIGTKGTIEGVEYEVYNCQVKHVKKYGYRWVEYTLYNPIEGIRYLAEYDGHWNFLKPIKGNPIGDQLGKIEFEYEGSSFRLYQKFKAAVYFAKGEFFTDVFSAAEHSTCYEYIAPPYVLTLEQDHNSSQWCKGEYMKRSDVIDAFKLSSHAVPKSEGRGYTQPFVSSFRADVLSGVCLALAGLVITLQIFLAATSKNRLVFEQTFYQQDLQKGQNMFVTPSFLLDDGTKSMEIEVRAPLANDWFFGDFVLVNETDLTEYEFSKEMEYYYGTEDGESWSEGSKLGSAFLSRIPEGRYHFKIYPEFSYTNKQFSIKVIRDVWNLSNMWITLLILAIFPIYYFVRMYYIESARWSDSDYSPYDE